jgi:hypothetical protein
MEEDGYHQVHGHHYAWGRMIGSDVGRNSEHSEMHSNKIHIKFGYQILNEKDSHQLHGGHEPSTNPLFRVVSNQVFEIL